MKINSLLSEKCIEGSDNLNPIKCQWFDFKSTLLRKEQISTKILWELFL